MTQWFPTLDAHQNHLEMFIMYRYLSPTSRDFDFIVLGIGGSCKRSQEVLTSAEVKNHCWASGNLMVQADKQFLWLKLV